MIVKGIVKMYKMIQITPHQQKVSESTQKKLYHPLQKGLSGVTAHRYSVNYPSEISAKKSRLNCSNPTSVSTCFDILSNTLGGIVHISAPTPKATPTD